MESYTRAFGSLEKLLADFQESGVIDTSKLDLIDPIVESTERDQVKVLNISYLSLDGQRAVFGGMRSIQNTGIMLKEKLKTASERHENPTTVELALEIMPHLLNVAKYLDEFITRGKVEIAKIREFSRILHKKAKSLGFSRDSRVQLDEAGITSAEIKTFLEDLNKNISLEMETEGEPTNENSDRDIHVD